MDRYDAILEHLRKAQSSGLDAVTGRLGAVVENLDELIQAAKSAVQESVPTDATECFPVNEIEAIVAELREDAAQEAAQPPPGITLDFLRTLDAARSQSELLTELLPALAKNVGRAVVMVIREGAVTAWSGIGFTNGERLKDWHGDVTESPVFEHIMETSAPLRFDPESDPLLRQWLEGETPPEEAVLLPISLRGKLMGAVYVDHSGDDPWNLEFAQSQIAVTCWLIDTLHHREKVPTAMLADIVIFESTKDLPPPEDVADDFAPEPEDEVPAPEYEAEEEEPSPEADEEGQEPEEIVLEEPEPEAEEPEFEAEEEDSVRADEVEIVEEPAAYEPEVVSFEPPEPEMEADFEIPADDEFSGEPEVVEFEPDFEPESVDAVDEAAEPAYDPSATLRVDVGESFASHETPAEAEEPPAAPPEVVEEPEEQPAAEEMQVPPPVQPLEPPPDIPELAEGDTEDADSSLAPEDQTRHEEAQRFARLLVSEIKLYNEDEVDRGRADMDLYTRLKEDIDRSREMYEKRISPEIRADHDYFHDELVRILADGESDALGM
jgi:hypothetical protein